MLKSSKYTFKQSNVDLEGNKFLIKKSAHLNDKLLDDKLLEIINKNAAVYCDNNVFSTRSFDNANARHQIVLEVNENNISIQERKRLI